MIGKKIFKERVITSSEAEKFLKASMKDDEEPIYEKKITLDHLTKFAKLKPKEAKKLVGELTNSNEKIREDIAVKIVDLMPKDENDVRVIFAKERYVLTKEDIEGILRITKRE